MVQWSTIIVFILYHRESHLFFQQRLIVDHGLIVPWYHATMAHDAVWSEVHGSMPRHRFRRFQANQALSGWWHHRPQYPNPWSHGVVLWTMLHGTMAYLQQFLVPWAMALWTMVLLSNTRCSSMDKSCSCHWRWAMIPWIMNYGTEWSIVPGTIGL